MLRVGPLYHRLDLLYDEWGSQVDAILGGLDCPRARLCSLEEIRRQLGALSMELLDRRDAIRKEMENDVDVHDYRNHPGEYEAKDMPVSGTDPGTPRKTRKKGG